MEKGKGRKLELRGRLTGVVNGVPATKRIMVSPASVDSHFPEIQ